MAGPQLTALAIADPPEQWAALGFAVRDGWVRLGAVSIELGAPGTGIVSWTLSGIDSAPALEGLPTTRVEKATAEVEISTRVNPAHPNGALGIDHVVIATPEFDRMAAALDAAGLTLRRIRQAGDRRQGFRRLGPAIMEIVEAPEADQSHFWGLTIVVADIEAARAHMGGHLGPARTAVQPGRHIATVRREARLSTRMALMDPE